MLPRAFKIDITHWPVSTCALCWTLRLLLIAVILHAGVPPAGLRAQANLPNTSEEEPDSRSAPEQEISASNLGSSAPRGLGLVRGGCLYLRSSQAAHCVVRPECGRVEGSEHSSRNGTGGPLRC